MLDKKAQSELTKEYVNSYWCHVKTGNIYTIKDVVWYCDTDEFAFEYADVVDYYPKFVRSIKNFLDQGRFVKLQNYSSISVTAKKDNNNGGNTIRASHAPSKSSG
jgi:hypothetical protein